jgi:hypothetical protein
LDATNFLFSLDTGYIDFVLDYFPSRDCTLLGFSGTGAPCTGLLSEVAADLDRYEYDSALEFFPARDCSVLGFSGTGALCTGPLLENTTDLDRYTTGDAGGSSTGGSTGGAIDSPSQDPGTSYGAGAQPAADVDSPATLVLMGLGLLALGYFHQRSRQGA